MRITEAGDIAGLFDVIDLQTDSKDPLYVGSQE